MQEIIDILKAEENREVVLWIISVIITNGFLIWRKYRVEKSLFQVVDSVEKLKGVMLEDPVEVQSAKLILGANQDYVTTKTVQKIQKKIRRDKK